MLAKRDATGRFGTLSIKPCLTTAIISPYDRDGKLGSHKVMERFHDNDGVHFQ